MAKRNGLTAGLTDRMEGIRSTFWRGHGPSPSWRPSPINPNRISVRIKKKADKSPNLHVVSPTRVGNETSRVVNRPSHRHSPSS
jgi:hypothetical protein